MSIFVLSNGPHQRKERPDRTAPVVEAPPVPPEQLIRRDATIRFQRNSVVYAVDGEVAVLRQVVIDELGEISDMIVEATGTGHRFAMPVDLVDRSAGHAIFLNAHRVDFDRLRLSAPPHDGKAFKAVKIKKLIKNPGADLKPRHSVLSWSRHLVETPAPRAIGEIVARRTGMAAD